MPESEPLCIACGLLRGFWYCEECDAFYFDETNICESCGKEVELAGKPRILPSTPSEEDKSPEPLVHEVSAPGNWF
jgi:hypothetical protein